MENSEKRKKGLDIININDRIETESNERAGRTGRKKEKMNEPTINQPTAEQAPTQPAPAPAYDEAKDLQDAINALKEAQERAENAERCASDAEEAADEAGRAAEACRSLLNDMEGQLEDREHAADEALERAEEAKAAAEKAKAALKDAYTTFGAYTAKRRAGATPEEATRYAMAITGRPQEDRKGYFQAIETMIDATINHAEDAETSSDEAEKERDTATDDYDELGLVLSGVSY